MPSRASAAVREHVVQHENHQHHHEERQHHGEHRHGAHGPHPSASDRDQPQERTHPPAQSPTSPTGWAMAIRATLHCLTGCAIGEVLGMAIGTALGWHDVPTLVLAIVLAFFFGYLLTVQAVLRARVGLRAAVGIALAADTLSITVMEAVDNGVLLLVPGAMDAGLSDALFWGALAFALAVAFVVTAPVNKWLIARGRGHAVMHQHHHG
ncbi:DUF4396 domain-containing protein [Streptomyces sp. 4N509B]|uniref:DUF4396 domain-containing protein n=1 Tax=Streptomyces sp. 4N509B TaxID=3457413 RepID=UPI003FCF68DE